MNWINKLTDCKTSLQSVAQAYLNQHKIDAEVRKLQTNVSQFFKQTAQWLSLMEGLNNSVKVGDCRLELIS